MRSDLLTIIEEDNGAAPPDTSVLGTRGEALAAEFLRSNGFRIVMSNFKVPVGRNSRGAQVTGEIDLVALDGETLCFVEVKTKRSGDFAPPTANVDLRKQRQIIRTARLYRRIFDVLAFAYRFDVVSILIPDGREPQIELLKGCWNEAKFRKRAWKTAIFDKFV
jgi:putative endonuclease